MSNFSTRVIFVTLALLGLFLVPFLAYKLVPDNIYPSLKISFSYPNASERIVEEAVTSKLEGLFSNSKNLKKVYSKSYSGYGEIFLEYIKAVKIEEERYRISTLIKQAISNLPNEVSYPKITYQRHDESTVTLLNYSIISKNRNTDIKDFIDKKILPVLTKYAGINQVLLQGIAENQLKVYYNTTEMKKLNISEGDLEKAIKSFTTNESIGQVLIDNSEELVDCKIISKYFLGKEKFGAIPVKKVDSRIIRLMDIATVSYDNSKEINRSRINGANTINLTIIADENANQIILAKNIKTLLETIENGNSTYSFVLVSDATVFLEKELEKILFRTLLSLFFLIVITFIIYRKLNYVAVLLTSMIVTILISCISFYILKIDIHIYSLMAITISLGFVIDNSVITIDHFSQKNDKQIILPIIAATITTIAPLAFIFTQNDEVKINLNEFSLVLIIVLVSSILVSFFLIPAILPSQKLKTITPLKKKKRLVKFNKFYLSYIYYFRKTRVLILIIVLFGFGIPVYLLPEKIDDSSQIGIFYNSLFSDPYYLEEIKPIVDISLGGVSKLFFDNSTETEFINKPKRTSLLLYVETPFGSDISYLNNVCKKIEKSISINQDFGIDFFETNILNERNAKLEVFFKSEVENLMFPINFKGFIVNEVLTITGANVSVTGIGDPFSTGGGGNVYDSTIFLRGYDYDELTQYASILKKDIEKNNRISDVDIKSEFSYYSEEKKRFVLETNMDHSVSSDFFKKFTTQKIGSYINEGKKIYISSIPSSKDKNSFYNVLNTQFAVNDSSRYKPKYNFEIDLKNSPDKIIRKDKEYQLVLQYKFKGTSKHSKYVNDEIIKEFGKKLKMGFSIDDGSFSNANSNSFQNFKSVIICLLIILSVCAILFESFKKSFAIILTIPVTFIGLFLTLFFLEIGFNSGVYGALILLTGLLVNSSIFIVNEYINNTKQMSSKKSYTRAFNKKINPIIITVISTIVGLLPFLIFNTTVKDFWYSFSITICLGLLFSLITIVFILPVYIVKNSNK